jgi:hypothetical protein
MNNDGNAKPITTSQQAIDQFVGEQFIEWLASFVLLEMRANSGLVGLKNKAVKIEKLRKFLLQRFLANEAFWGVREGDPGFLSFIIANLSESSDPQAETILEYLEKCQERGLLRDRPGIGTSGRAYSQDWERLLKVLGVAEEDRVKASPKPVTRSFVAELSDIYSDSDWYLAIGALAAQELAESEENRVLYDLVKANAQVLDQDLEFLFNPEEVNSQAMIFVSKILEKIVFDEEIKGLIVQGARRQLDIRKDFFGGLMKYL